MHGDTDCCRGEGDVFATGRSGGLQNAAGIGEGTSRVILAGLRDMILYHINIIKHITSTKLFVC